jgi:dienelactone hydrolase
MWITSESASDAQLATSKNRRMIDVYEAVAKTTRMPIIFALVVVLMLISGLMPLGAQTRPGPQGPEGELRRQDWLLLTPQPGFLMRAVVYRPIGAGPFPLAVINHGTSQNAALREMLEAPRFDPVVEWFVARGYAIVVPQRPGHGATGGHYLEDLNGCAQADFRKAGLGAAASIAAAVEFMTAQPFVRKNGVVLVGKSAGAWGSLALASRNPRAVGAVINFAGGRSGRVGDLPNRNCAPERLIEAARSFGNTARTPTLWIYAENDTFFGPALSRRMAEAFKIAGGQAEYHLLPAFGTEGHHLIDARDAVPLWGPLAEKFLQRVKKGS